MDGPDCVPGHRQDRRFAAGAGRRSRGRNRSSTRLELPQTGAQGFADLGVYAMQQQSPPEAVRSGRHGRRSEQPAAAEDHRDRHQDVRDRGGDGGDPENPAAVGRAHHRSDRQHGLAARLDRRHHRRGSGRRAMPRGDWARAAGREMARRKKLCRRLARHRRGRAQAPGGARCRALRPVPGDGGEPARQRPAQSAGYLSGLCDAGPDDHPDQRPAIYRLQEIRMGRGRRDRLRRFMGAGAQDRRALAVAAVLRRAALRRRAR